MGAVTRCRRRARPLSGIDHANLPVAPNGPHAVRYGDRALVAVLGQCLRGLRDSQPVEADLRGELPVGA